MTTIPCPKCNGTGTGGAFLLRGRIVTAPCSLCSGATYVSIDVAKWIPIGEKHRRERIEAGVGLRERASTIGITAARLSAMESGREDNSMLEEIARQ
jgi:hypothetical protein